MQNTHLNGDRRPTAMYVLIKRFEPAQSKFGAPPTLSGMFSHPDRYRLSVAEANEMRGVLWCQELGREGRFPFPDNFCPNYLGEYPAVIVGVLDNPGDRHLFKVDKFIEYSSRSPEEMVLASMLDTLAIKLAIAAPPNKWQK